MLSICVTVCGRIHSGSLDLPAFFHGHNKEIIIITIFKLKLICLAFKTI